MKFPLTGQCHYCEHELSRKQMSWDHKIPKCFGGKRGENLVLCCKTCNLLKGGLSYDVFIKHRKSLFSIFWKKGKRNYFSQVLSPIFKEVKRREAAKGGQSTTNEEAHANSQSAISVP